MSKEEILSWKAIIHCYKNKYDVKEKQNASKYKCRKKEKYLVEITNKLEFDNKVK